MEWYWFPSIYAVGIYITLYCCARWWAEDVEEQAIPLSLAWPIILAFAAPIALGFLVWELGKKK